MHEQHYVCSLCYNERTIYSCDTALAALVHSEPLLKKKKKEKAAKGLSESWLSKSLTSDSKFIVRVLASNYYTHKHYS